MPVTAVSVLLLLAFLLFPATGSHHRRLLHQPFFHVITEAPSPSPSPQPQNHHKSQPKYPFSTTPSTPKKPFFPSYSSSSPPPPSPAIVNTFPANISVLFPHRQTSSTHRHLVITIAVSLSLFFAAVLTAISAFIIYFRHHHHHLTTNSKPPRSDSLRLFPPNTAPSDASPKTHHNHDQRRTPNTSTEFLYLGTLVNSRGANNEIATNSSGGAGIKIGVTSSPPYQRLGSPELKPLPPLPRLNCLHGFNSGEVNGDSDAEEEFFSPRGSSGRKETLNLSPVRQVSASRIEDQVLQGESSKFGSRSFNSRTASCPYSNPYSPSNSVSASPSPTSNVSPGSLKSRSPDSPAPPQPESRSPTLTFSPSLPSGSDCGNALILQERTRPVPTREPPQPPPPPPLRFWEVPVGQPVLLTPSRQVVFQNVTPPVLSNEQSQTVSESVESKSEETTPKPKLKPLHWDKVRASSDRVMVWDQIKSSSFK